MSDPVTFHMQSISLLWEKEQGTEVTRMSKPLHQGQADVLQEERQMQCPEGKADVGVTGMVWVQPVPKGWKGTSRYSSRT